MKECPKYIFFVFLACLYFFALTVRAETTDDTKSIDHENHLQKIEEIKKITEGGEDLQLKKKGDPDTDIKKNLSEIENRNSISKKDRQNFSSQGLSAIPFLNGNFELGHQSWIEAYKSYDGNWYEWNSIILSGSGGYGSWYAYLMENEWLESAPFKLPVNTRDIYLQYDAQFVHWGTCSYGLNGVQVFIYDNTTESIVGTLGFHDAGLDEYDYEYYTYYATLDNVASVIGHDLSLHYLSYNNDPNCSFALYLDNVMPIANKNDACINGNCKVYRFQNKHNGTYLFIASENEANSVIYNYGETFRLEGVAYSVPTSGNPMYRFQNKSNGTYLFTGEEEKNGVIANYSHTFKLEGLAFYTQPGAGTPIYRFRNKGDGTYLFVGEGEKNSVLANYSHTFELEGLAFYAAN